MTDIRDYQGGRVFIIGIGGSSTSGLALLLKDRGYSVSGSNSYDSEIVQGLIEQGIPVTIVNDPEGIGACVEGSDFAVYTQAIPEDSDILAAVRKKGVPLLSRSELLGQLSRGFRRSVAVCGTHGKTTVTSMLAMIMIDAGVDPTVHIGGVLPPMGGSVRSGKSDVFLTEACEYKRSFLSLDVTDILLLNMDEDHLDYFRDMTDIESAFGEFLSKLPEDGWALGNGDDDRVKDLLERTDRTTATFGVSESCDYRMKNLTEDHRGFCRFDLYYNNEDLGHVEMAVPGVFNGKNAAAALACAHHMGLDMASALRTIGAFTGASRRFERTGTVKGIELFHDYGHNPVEMSHAVEIARKRCMGGRLWAVIQPHTYTRVESLFEDYLSCTREADVTLVTDIYGAREVDTRGVSSDMLVEGMKARGVNAILTPTFDDAARVILEDAKAGDLVITLGCGNIYLLNELLEEKGRS